MDRELLASRRAVQLLGMSRSRDTSTSVPQPLPDALILENEADLASKSTTSSHPPSVERPPQQQQQQQHGHHGNHNKQWPQFAYHRVTASPISNSPAASAPPGRHRSAFVAVSAVTPAQQQRPRQMLQQQHVSHHVPPSSTELPDAMDTLLAARTPIREPVISDQRTSTGSDAAAEEAAEEREIERIEQLQALEALHAQIEAKWRAQEDNRGHNK
ncbi:hypothetical protein B566_EDAN011268 [Ephemera danica]|nr:hypothetical protein B566_EDAN011268 [Ephemera danica]